MRFLVLIAALCLLLGCARGATTWIPMEEGLDWNEDNEVCTELARGDRAEGYSYRPAKVSCLNGRGWLSANQLKVKQRHDRDQEIQEEQRQLRGLEPLEASDTHEGTP